MAEGYESPKDWLGQIKGSSAEAKQRANELYKQRIDEGKKSNSRILGKNDIANGKWDASRVLTTTMGGVTRAITKDDLVAFKKNMDTVSGNFEHGIIPQQVINHSLPIDRERATKQITMAVAVSASKGKVRFITNAGGETPNVHRHHVLIEFLKYDQHATSTSKSAKESAKELRKSPIKLDCDCGRFQFFYRYVASIGGFNAGKPETGYPRVRNPNLTGVACKHLLRVMQEIASGGLFSNFLVKHIEKGKVHDENLSKQRTSQKEAEKITKSQAKRTSDKHAVKIKAAIEKARKENPKETKKKAPATKAAKPNKNMTDPHAQMRLMLKQLGQTDTQIEAMIAASIAAQGK